MRGSVSTLALSSLAWLSQVLVAAAWGRDGHRITAQVAQALLGEDQVARASSILGGVDLAAVANWADEVRRDEEQWRWSGELHFINVPDGQCTFDYNENCIDRDGKRGNCVAGALLNYTSLLMTSTDHDTLQTALKFVVHFAGDIHQPLHVGWTSDEGGNTIQVEESWEHDDHTNLHAVWDEGLLDGIEDAGKQSEEEVASSLVQELRTGSMSGSLQAWSECGSRDDTAALLQCITEIASESIRDACSYAYVDAQGERVATGEALDEAYFETRAPVVRRRLAAGGARLAAILKYALAAAPFDIIFS